VGCYQKGQRVWIGETGLRNVSCLKIVENSNCVSQGWPQSASQSVPDFSIDTSDASCRIPLIGGQAHTNQQDRQSWPWWWMRPVQQRCEESERQTVTFAVDFSCDVRNKTEDTESQEVE
jgi:hypothetical protein